MGADFYGDNTGINDATESGKPERRRKSYMWILVGLLAVSLVVALVGLLMFISAKKPTDEPTTPEITQTPSEVVQAYLEALAGGHASEALTYSKTVPSETILMTDEFLQQSLAEHPMTNIVVPTDQTIESPAEIFATYDLGEQKVEAHFTVQLYENGWLLDRGFLPLNVSELVGIGVRLKLNDVDLGTATTTVNLLPGTYTFTSLDPMLTVANGTFVLEYPETTPTYSMAMALSDDAIKAIQAAAKAKMKWCLTQKSLQPDGCGFGFAGVADGSINPDTISWSYANKAPKFANIKPELDGTSLTSAVASFSVKVTFQALSEDRANMYQQDSSFKKLHADFTNPNNIIVTFGT